MRDAPHRIWHDLTTGIVWHAGENLPGTPYILATPAALAEAPEVAALIREAEARGMERAAQEVEGWAVQSYDASISQAADAIRAEAAALKGETT